MKSHLMNRRTILSSTIFFLVVASWLLLLRPVTLGGPASYIIVSGPSMEPSFHTGDLAVLHKQDRYQPGDVAAFLTPGGIVIHRVLDEPEPGIYRFKGDNNSFIDPWLPTRENILGKLWVHLPGAGFILNNLRHPVNLAALGCLAVLLLLDEPVKRKGRKKRGRRMDMNNKIKLSGITAPLWALVLLIPASLLSILGLTGAFISLRQPLQRTSEVPTQHFQHTSAFVYTIRTEPSVLYPTSAVGPVGPLPPSEPTSSPARIFSRLIRTLDLDFYYQLVSDHPAQINGKMQTLVRVSAGDGWSHELSRTSEIVFEGVSVQSRTAIDFAQVQDLIEQVEEETGYYSGSYLLEIVPQVSLSGFLGGADLNTVYAPVFTAVIEPQYTTFESQLSQVQLVEQTEQVTLTQTIQLLGLQLTVRTARFMSLAAAAVGLLAVLVLSLVVFIGIGQTRLEQIQARYGGMIVSVSSTKLLSGPAVQVASMQDLVRVAQRDGSVILHKQRDDGSNLFFIPDGNIVYSYLVKDKAGES
jgi:signal peptidase I